jgi:hypothetical protein
MKATEAGLLAFLKKSPQFVIPIYQRTYSWTDKECRQLWNDILRTGSNSAISVHCLYRGGALAGFASVASTGNRWPAAPDHSDAVACRFGNCAC